jgi:hypothetical protein
MITRFCFQHTASAHKMVGNSDILPQDFPFGRLSTQGVIYPRSHSRWTSEYAGGISMHGKYLLEH